jgi:hypothetical protein
MLKLVQLASLFVIVYGGYSFMARNPGKSKKFGSKKMLISIGVIGILLGAGFWGLMNGVFGGAHAGGNTSQTSATTLSLTQPVSPLLFGTNMGLFNSSASRI